MQNAAFIDIVTTENDLYGHHNSPVQFYIDLVSDEFLHPSCEYPNFGMKGKLMNIVPDEETSQKVLMEYDVPGDIDKSGFNLRASLDVIYRFLSGAQKKGLFLIGYNHVDYDLRILNEHFQRLLEREPVVFQKDRIIDVMELAECVLPVEDVISYSMPAVYQGLFGSSGPVSWPAWGRRTAKIDVELAEWMLKKLGYMALSGDNAEYSYSELVRFIAAKKAENDTIWFGKYKGLDILDVLEKDAQYLAWMVSNKAISEKHPELVAKIKNILNSSVE